MSLKIMAEAHARKMKVISAGISFMGNSLSKAAQSVGDSGRVRPARSGFAHALRLEGSLRDP
jgi:hypothetical protein